MKVLLKIILFIFIFFILFYFIFKNIYIKKALSLKYWKNKYSKHQDELLEHVKNIIPYLEKWKVRYWAHAGTLLGCIRHGDIIPWDDDIDFGYIDDGNIQNLIEDLENNNFQINYNFLGIEIDIKIGFQIINKNNNKIVIDMFKFTKENDMLMQTTYANKRWPKENYYYDQVFPLKKAKFNNIYLPIPNKSDEFCKRAFSDKYIDEFYIKKPHTIMFLNNII